MKQNNVNGEVNGVIAATALMLFNLRYCLFKSSAFY